MARLFNSQHIDPDAEVSLLRDVNTNEPLQGPTTYRSIESMPSNTVNALLTSLSADTTGSIEVSRKRLRMMVGLRAERA
jgi:hypothetical protein